MRLFKSLFLSLTIVVLSSLLLCACTQTDEPDPTQLIGRWQLTKVIYEDDTIAKMNPYNGRYEVEIEFLIDGKISGTTSSNTIGGTYEVSEKDSIAIRHSLESKVGENSWGRYFNQGIPAIKTYTLQNSVLILYFEDNRLIFEKVK